MKDRKEYERKKLKIEIVPASDAQENWVQGDEEHHLWYGMPIMFERRMREDYLMECGAPECHSTGCNLAMALGNYISYIEFRTYDWKENKVRLKRIAEYVQVKPPRFFITENPLLQRTLGKRPVAIYDRGVPWYNLKKNIKYTIWKNNNRRPTLLFEGEPLTEFLKQELKSGSSPAF